VESISQQESPLVQAAMADVMLKLQEKNAVKPLKKLLQQKNLNVLVRNKVEAAIARLI
jgi:HEAT repeat protein